MELEEQKRREKEKAKEATAKTELEEQMIKLNEFIGTIGIIAADKHPSQVSHVTLVCVCLHSD